MDNFVVSARKYRPATFASVVGQGHITSTLKNAVSRNQLAHAYLFCGPRGVGKTTCARIFAKAINCLSPAQNEACNECESCRSFNESRSFSIHELDAASNNSVDDIRSLTDQVRIPPQVGRYSVYIIDEVHMLSSAAFNAFLKTLEEPPAHAVFILATTEKHKILPTILSRCQIFDFNRIKVEDMVGYLKYIGEQEGVVSDDESLNLIAAKAEGGMRDALSMFDKAVSFCGRELSYVEVAKTLNVLDYDTYFDLTKAIVSGDYPATLLLFDEVLTRGFSPHTFVAGLGTHFRDLMMSKDPKTAVLLDVTGSLPGRYRQQSDECDSDFLFEAISLLAALDGSLRTATNQRLNVELGLMKLCRPGQKKNEPVTVAAIDIALPQMVEREAGFEPEATGTAGQREPKETTGTAGQREPKETTGTAGQREPKEITGAVEALAVGSARPVANATTQSTISGTSIAELLNNSTILDDTACDADDAADDLAAYVDPLSERKIRDGMERFVRTLHGERPRIAMAFDGMEVEGSVVTVKVISEDLYEEIMRCRTEILLSLASISGAKGVIELNVRVVKDDPTARKPIKSEDKLRYLSDKNPALSAFKRVLGLDID